MGASDTIDEGEGVMSDVRSTSRIEDVEDGYGDDEENEPEPENGSDGDEASIFAVPSYGER